MHELSSIAEAGELNLGFRTTNQASKVVGGPGTDTYKSNSGVCLACSSCALLQQPSNLQTNRLSSLNLVCYLSVLRFLSITPLFLAKASILSSSREHVMVSLWMKYLLSFQSYPCQLPGQLSGTLLQGAKRKPTRKSPLVQPRIASHLLIPLLAGLRATPLEKHTRGIPPRRSPLASAAARRRKTRGKRCCRSCCQRKRSTR